MPTTTTQPINSERINHELDRALGLALGFVLSRQRRDGSWVDWDLPPGESSIWTTAYVGGKLSRLPTSLKRWATVPMNLAADWLAGKTFPDNGWGYDEAVGSDADSTALAIQFLASQRRKLPDACYTLLRHFQCADGGFATYSGQPNLGSWATSHCDVTPTAALAMMTKHDAANARASNETRGVIDRAVGFILDQQTSDGVWNSFWWASPLYSTEASLSLLNTVGAHRNLQRTSHTLLAVQPKHPFEAALLLSSLLLLQTQPSPINEPIGERSDQLVEQLIEEQESDGGWRTGPMLRITSRNSHSPWKQGDQDPLFCDQNRLFTTTTVIDALSRAMSASL